ncbi:MAG: glycosyltransferase [Prevotellaceae bacterium]|jgi:glycosyltransferase involved in cell wall biosynthesis|nr:glycosyltransferase [Prevotellaceae bacterium]
MFSIIIPLYNKAKYVEKALQSVVNQTFKEFEIIVIDDGSTDNSLNVVRNFQIFKFSNLKIIQQQNSGVSVARNNGVKIAKYDYIVFLDADDWWAENYLEEMVKLINDFPDAALWASSYFKVKNGKNIPAKIGVAENFERGYFDYFEAYSRSPYMPVNPITATIKKSVFNEMGGFKPKLKLGEDFDLWARIALKYRTALINKQLAFYNQDVEQQSRGVVFEKIYEPTTHFIFNLDYLQEQEAKNPVLKQVLDNLRVYTLARYYTQNQYVAEFQKEIGKVDFEKQPESMQKFYKTPRTILKIKSKIIHKLHRLKQIIH